MARSLTLIRRWFSGRRAAAGAGAVVVLITAAIFAPDLWKSQQADAKAPRGAKPRAEDESETAAPSLTPREVPDPVCIVNRQPISKDQLGEVCLKVYGADVLDSLMHKLVIVYECERLGISVSEEEVDAEIARVAANFRCTVEQFYETFLKQRGADPEQYRSEMIWPTVALRKLAADQITVTDEDIDRAYETLYGPSVLCRLIACPTRRIAEDVRTQALDAPEEFHNLAKRHSQDLQTASSGGLLQPIRRHQGPKEIEQLAFQLEDGEISEVFEFGDRFVFIKRENASTGRDVSRAEVEKALADGVRDSKLKDVMSEKFASMEEEAQLVNVWADPGLREQHPGVAAIIHDRPLSIEELRDECIRRHGSEVLGGVISRTLLEQALERKQLVVAQEDLDAEMTRAAVALRFTDNKDQPDVEAYLKDAQENSGLSQADFIHDVVWPTVALKKLVGGEAEVTEDDIVKGYEANFGPRVRCRAIVCNQQRKAQELWELARDDQTIENFGKLAERHSVDSQSAALQGEIPPIQKWTGNDKLEKEAFALTQASPLSGVISIENQWVILFYEGMTRPLVSNIDDVRDQIYADIHEKKLRAQMAVHYQELEDRATIENILDGTSHAPKTANRATPDKPAAAKKTKSRRK